LLDVDTSAQTFKLKMILNMGEYFSWIGWLIDVCIHISYWILLYE
jgi:hypothetical protein